MLLELTIKSLWRLQSTILETKFPFIYQMTESDSFISLIRNTRHEMTSFKLDKVSSYCET